MLQQRLQVTSDLPDKPVGGGKLGKKGQRWFAASTGRRRAEFETIQTVQWGAVWLKLGQEKLEMYGARVSFVFKRQSDHVERAPTRLSQTVMKRTTSSWCVWWCTLFTVTKIVKT